MDDKVTDWWINWVDSFPKNYSEDVVKMARELIVFRRQAQEAPKAASDEGTRECFNSQCSKHNSADPFPTCDGICPKAASQSAENIVDEISDLLEHEQYQRSVSLIKDAFAAQRQAGREEVAKEFAESERVGDKYNDVEISLLAKRYAAVVEAAREAIDCMDERRCYSSSWEWKHAERWDKEDAAIRKSLSDLEEASDMLDGPGGRV